jgi:hypothetical protein
MPNVQTQTPIARIPPSRIAPEAMNRIDANDSNLAGWVQAQSVLLIRSIDIAESTHAFSQSRLRTNLDTCTALMSCQNWWELVGLQREYAEDAKGQYLDQFLDLSNRIKHCVGDMTPSSIDGGEL